jgi:nickel/cobalt exporter
MPDNHERTVRRGARPFEVGRLRGLSWLIALAAVLPGAALDAHPVPRSDHDRTIVVHLLPGHRPDRLIVRVEYRLEVDETTVLLEDMQPYRDEIDFVKYRNKPLEFYAEYARIYESVLAGNLLGKLNNKAVTFTCIERTPHLVDEKRQPLGHLRCDFVFHADLALDEGKPNTFWFREANYILQSGKIIVGWRNGADLKVVQQETPSAELQERPATEWEPGDEERLRRFKIVFTRDGSLPAAPPSAPVVAPVEPPPAPAPSVFDDDASLLWLITGDYSFWLMMLGAMAFGAAHALTPGHGKTLVAAYLIGERGTVWHAVVLGFVTTLTHTGAVLVLAAILFFLPEQSRLAFGRALNAGLGLVAGLMVVCLGFWLLLQRLAGRPDHVHFGDHGHSHSHGHGPSHSPASSDRSNVGWWGVITLGVAGGLIPCADAIWLLVLLVGRGEFWLALPALIAFSIGLAFVLVLIGVLVVRVPRFAQSRLGDGRVVHALPIVSALVIIGMGVWLCYKTVGTT